MIGGTALIGAHAWAYGSWMVDDSAITFSYARSISEGLGPVVQPGAEPVEGFSNPTWTMLLAIGRLLGLFDRGTLFGIPDYVLFPKLLGLLFCAGILTACYLAVRKTTRRPWLVTLGIGAVLAAIPSFVIWCFSGLENSLFAFAVTCLAALLFRAVMDGRLHSARVALLAGVLAAVAALTRPDGAIYAATYALVVLCQLRRSTLKSSVGYAALSLVGFAVPYGSYLTWRFFEFDRLVPNTAVAKGQHFPGVSTLARTGDLVGYAGALAVLVLVLIVGIALARASALRAGLITLMVPLGLGVVAYAVLERDWMGQYRFATPVWVLATLIGALATAEVVRRTRGRVRVLVPLALVVAMIPSLAVFAGTVRDFRAKPTIPMCYIADRFGRVFNQYADILGLDQASLLEPDLGGSSMTSRLNIVDMAGLVDAKIADFYHDHDMAGLRDYVFNDVKPTFIHSRGPWGPGNGIARDSRLATDYTPIFRYVDDGSPVGDGDWVRKDAVASLEKLQAARSYADATVRDMEHRLDTWPRRHCGDTLRPGQTNINQSS
ncbi:hypothetical protein [Amycolatopsis taiwanensis]|uniref:Glycosyltransferase RgtA/B/C/D-like domain-containing protein n=1 Tax=Amycolatopsis taiwanensis TaxID=342230 RepID=A0A9W6QXW6_9PSEU|nr:hypothetical protein [Amycolatopsis taiwanensis]GLY63985.1 hypothetical protein Atai01_06040 [Amycolatopsis taiwanensis]